MAYKLDEVDIQLLDALQADADRTNVELARLTGLSPAATLHRVRALKESGVIRIIRAHVDPAAAGFALQVYVTATLTRHDPRYERIFEDQVRALPQVISAENIAGENDYLLSIVARDVTELQQVLSRLAARGARVVTYLRLGEVKPPSPLPLDPAATVQSAPRRPRSASRETSAIQEISATQETNATRKTSAARETSGHPGNKGAPGKQGGTRGTTAH